MKVSKCFSVSYVLIGLMGSDGQLMECSNNVYSCYKRESSSGSKADSIIMHSYLPDAAMLKKNSSQ